MKKLMALILSLTLLFTAFTFTACQDPGGSQIPPTQVGGGGTNGGDETGGDTNGSGDNGGGSTDHYGPNV